MKKKSIIGLFMSLLGLGMTTTSCEDMLTPDMDLYTENFTGTDTVNFYFGILSDVQDVIENNLLLGEIRSDLVDTTAYVSDTVASISNFDKVADGDNGLLRRAAYYKVINQCNYYLAKADTMAQKNNSYYMRREVAQVQMIRAWTYMQLVQNYGSVPFITSPVDNADTGWETNPEGGWATPDNLLDKLLACGLEQAYTWEKTLGTPSYGTLNNGAMELSHSLLTFRGDLVLGDLYLLRGASKADYEKAANYYYTFMSEQAQYSSRLIYSSYAASLSRFTRNGRDAYSWSGLGSWSSYMDGGSSLSATGEVITASLSAANKTFGTVLTRAAQIYGFDPTSSSTTDTDVNDDNETEITTSGAVSLTANYRNRQVGPSRRYQNLSSSQIVRYNEMGTGSSDNILSVRYPEGLGDARIERSVGQFRTTVGDMNFMMKRGMISIMLTNSIVSSAVFNYTFPIYRLRQVYLRYAEAINRAGFPRYAFAVLRDGLNPTNLPEIMTDSVANGKIVPYASRVANGCSYIDINELRRASTLPYMDFTESYWDDNIGIHELGCGESSDLDTLYTYDLIVGQRMAEEAARVQGREATDAEIESYAAQLRGEDGTATDDEGDENAGEGDEEEDVDPQPADDPVIPEDIAEQINAVETLLADEMALETAFEGFRYYDLLRIARHKNNDVWNHYSGDYGTNWFAWTIARRSENVAPYASPMQYNSSLFTKLSNIENWYLQNPIY